MRKSLNNFQLSDQVTALNQPEQLADSALHHENVELWPGLNGRPRGRRRRGKGFGSRKALNLSHGT